jgi:hypothetical protein
MSLRLYPRCHPLRRLLLNRPLMHVAIRQATAIVTVSHSARRDLLNLARRLARSGVGRSRSRQPGVPPIADRAMLDDVRARYSLPKRSSSTSARSSRART